MENLSKKILITTLLFALCLISISSVNAAENTTDLGNLISTAAPNSEIPLEEGTYKTNVSNIIIDKNITIIGKGADKTIIDADKAGRIFNITDTGILTLINLTLINGDAEYGGAIYNYGKLTMTNCIVTNNTDSLYSGGAIYNSEGSDVKINNCIFTNNICTYGDGGAIYNGLNANMEINNSLFENNEALIYGGVICNWGMMNINNCNFTNNNAFGGAAIDNYETMYINNSKFSNNEARRDGGAIYNGKIMTIIGSNFTKNNASSDGGAIYNNGNQLTIINSVFMDNTADNGGAIMNQLKFSFMASSSTINYNDYNVMIINSTFKENIAGSDGGAICNNYYYYQMLVENSTFTNNIADLGGAIYNIGDNVLILSSNFNNNTGTNGSAIYNEYCDNLTIIDSNFTNNKGIASIYLMGLNTTITGCNIFNNSQGILINGDSDAIIQYNRIFNNTNNTGFDLDNYGYVEADYNWWGSNNPLVNGVELNNYFIMNVTNLTSLNSNGTVTFQYTFKLNNSDSFDATLLPYFVTDVYTNLTGGVITSFDARFDRTFDVAVNTSGDILYTFVTDNEVQTLEGKSIIPIPPIPPTPTPDPENPDKPKTNDNPVPASAATMKTTGIPINILLLIFGTVLAILIGRKQN